MAGAVDPTLHTAALAALEMALNRALALSPHSKTALAQLEDCVFALHCTAPRMDIYLHPGAQGIRLTSVHPGPVTTSIKGEAADFTELATSSDPTATLINGGLELEGDSAPLLELQRILAALDMDWEAPLVDALGDVAGHQLAQLLRHAFAWGKQAVDQPDQTTGGVHPRRSAAQSTATGSGGFLPGPAGAGTARRPAAIPH